MPLIQIGQWLMITSHFELLLVRLVLQIWLRAYFCLSFLVYCIVLTCIRRNGKFLINNSVQNFPKVPSYNSCETSAPPPLSVCLHTCLCMRVNQQIISLHHPSSACLQIFILMWTLSWLYKCITLRQPFYSIDWSNLPLFRSVHSPCSWLSWKILLMCWRSF